MARLSGKVAIITGAARGMGEATARLFVEQGAKVIIADILDEPGRAVAQSLGAAARYVRMDVTKQEDWNKAIAEAEKFGPLNVLVNNAGIIVFKSIVETTPEEYMKVVQINQLGAYIGLRSVIEPMKKAG